MRRAALALALLLSASAASATTFYWGPVKGTIASAQQAGMPTRLYEHRDWFVGETNTVTNNCYFLVNTYGATVGDPYVKAPNLTVFNAFVGAYTGPDVFYPEQSTVCTLLVPEGKCILMDGRYLSDPPALGYHWIVDHIAAATCP